MVRGLQKRRPQSEEEEGSSDVDVQAFCYKKTTIFRKLWCPHGQASG